MSSATSLGTSTDTGTTTMEDVNWREVLSRLREVRSRHHDEGEEDQVPAHDATTSEDDVDDDDFLAYLPMAAREVDGYVAALSDEGDGGGGAAVSLVPNVRRCLRVTQNLLSPRPQPRHQDRGGGDGDGPPVPPSAAQLAAVRAGLHLSLASLISSSFSEDVDTTCRTTAARTLCNLVTSNVESASIVAVDVPLSPIIGRTETTDHGSTSAVNDGDADLNDDSHCRHSGSRPYSCSWVDMIASPARRGERDAVAAVVASLHNCLASLDDDDDDGPPPVPPDGGRHEAGLEGGLDAGSGAELQRPEDIATPPRSPHPPIGGREFAADISGDRLLVCNLLRNILPVTAAASASSPSPSTDDGGVDEDQDHADGATEWISLLLTRLVRMGELPSLYGSAGGGRDGVEGGPRPEENDKGLVTPEQVVLLSCVSRAAGEESSSVVIPIEDSTTMESLASILSSMGCSVEESSSSSRREERYPGEDGCRAAVRCYVADILASSLLPRDEDQSSSPQRRRRLLADLGGGGPRCRLIERASLELGAAVDRVSLSNFGRGARDVTVPDVDGRLIKSLVRLIGNLCHRCPENRDLLREVEVPFLPGAGTAVGDEPGGGGCDSAPAVRDDGDGAVRDDDGSPSDGGDGAEAKTPTTKGDGRRSGLHVLLSCTSLCHGCFGLREWAVVAIRDALEENPANQKVLEELSPRAVASSPDELRGLGIDLELDEGGRVRVKRTQQDRG